MEYAQAVALVDLIEDLIRAVLEDQPPRDASESWVSDTASGVKKRLIAQLEST